MRLAHLLCARYGLKNSRKRKSYFTIKLQNLAYYTRGKGARGGSNSQLHKHPFSGLPREGAYVSSIRVGLLSLPFWAYTHVLGMLRERNRDVTGIGRGTLLLYPLTRTDTHGMEWFASRECFSRLGTNRAASLALNQLPCRFSAVQ